MDGDGQRSATALRRVESEVACGEWARKRSTVATDRWLRCTDWLL